MKKIFNICFIIAIAALLFSCQKVIDVNLDSTTPKLVVDAAIKWDKGTAGNEQTIKLTTTADYFGTTIPAATGAIVFVTNTSTGATFNFNEIGTTGNYTCSNFVPVIDNEYTLTIAYKNETYKATEVLKSIQKFDKIEQKNDGGFTGKQIEIKAYFTDNAATNDFYLFEFQTSYSLIPTYDVNFDRFFNGNQFFTIFIDKDLQSGQDLKIKMYGITERYYNYMNKLTTIAGSQGGSPFQTPPATVRGNVLNTTNDGNFPLGYFSLSEVESVTYLIK